MQSAGSIVSFRLVQSRGHSVQAQCGRYRPPLLPSGQSFAGMRNWTSATRACWRWVGTYTERGFMQDQSIVMTGL